MNEQYRAFYAGSDDGFDGARFAPRPASRIRWRSGGGYAELVRQVAPSVVTVLVEEKREGAGQRAAERATANMDPTGVNELLATPARGAGRRRRAWASMTAERRKGRDSSSARTG